MNIPISFCFDENMYTHAGVTITSLLVNSKDKCAYDIYCVIPNALPQQCRESLTALVGKYDSASKITFLNAAGAFDNAFVSGLTISTYYRLLLPNLLPHLDKIIYADTDVIFARDLSELWNTARADTDYLIAGVKPPIYEVAWPKACQGAFAGLKKETYVSAGFLIMNLKALREGDFWDTWVELATKHTPFWHDQDILNLTCEGRKLFIEERYNYPYYYLYTKEDPSIVMIHYGGGKKPWNARMDNVFKIWWDYAALTPFYESFKTVRFPKPIAHIICWFIPTVARRRAFRKKHMWVD